MGMSQTKALARGYVWWPGLDSDIEGVVRDCEACKMNQSKPASSVPHTWVKPTGPWEFIWIFWTCLWINVASGHFCVFEVDRSDKDVKHIIWTYD